MHVKEKPKMHSDMVSVGLAALGILATCGEAYYLMNHSRAVAVPLPVPVVEPAKVRQWIKVGNPDGKFFWMGLREDGNLVWRNDPLP